MGTPNVRTRMNKANCTSPQAQQAKGLVATRLLDLAGTAAYLCISTWTVRDLEAADILVRVRVPLTNNGELRKILFDRNDLDALIEKWKDQKTFHNQS